MTAFEAAKKAQAARVRREEKEFTEVMFKINEAVKEGRTEILLEPREVSPAVEQKLTQNGYEVIRDRDGVVRVSWSDQSD